MIMFDQTGPAQIAAILVLVQRGAEELYSQATHGGCWPKADTRKAATTIRSLP